MACPTFLGKFNTSPKAQYDILSKSIDIYPIIKDIIINKKLGVLKYEKGSIY